MAFSRAEDPATIIHKQFYRISWEYASTLGRLRLIGKALSWPLIVFGTASYFTYRNGGIVQRRLKKSHLRQFSEQIWLGLRYAILPRVYYAYELFLPEKRTHVAGFLQRFETKSSLYVYLKEAVRLPCTPANDKLHFERYVLTHNLPTVRSVAAFSRGRRVDSDEPVALPPVDLFIKPINGRGGEDCMRYRYTAGHWQAAHSDALLTADQFLQQIVHFSRRTPCLIQQRYRSHHALTDLAGEALATIRVLSMTTVCGQIEVLYAAFRMPRHHNAVVDNFHAGGIAASVDLKTGQLGSATDLGNDQSLGWVDVHPASGAAIRGRVLPMWQEALELVRTAHGRAFSDRAMLGWDIAITNDGPIIVEGNGGPDLDIIQRVCNVPLGYDRFGELMVEHLLQPRLAVQSPTGRMLTR